MFLAYFVFVFFVFVVVIFFSFILFYFINSLLRGKEEEYRILQKGVLIKYLKLVKKMVWKGVLQETFCRRGGFDV